MGPRLKHRWSLANNYMAGITAGDWFRLLSENRFSVDPAYWHRAAFVSALSVVNSIHRRDEEKRFGAMWAEAEIHTPLFVLGHWRSGTTHLHNLLAHDTRNFAYANTYQVVNPHTFLTTEEKNSRRFAWMVPGKRLMDDVALNLQSPQEDEFAPCLMSLRSLYLGISFPRNEELYSRFLTFETASREDRESWMVAFRTFLAKLSLKYNRPLVLKSPPHTARIRMLLEMFPDARFVHIHRNPYEVFRSCRHFYDTAPWYSYLQRPDLNSIDDGILHRYSELHDAFFADLPLIPEGQFHEIRFDDLERDPVEQVRGLYQKLSIDGFESFEPVLEGYLQTLAGYRKNRFEPLAEETRARVAKAWRRNFETWNYPI